MCSPPSAGRLARIYIKKKKIRTRLAQLTLALIIIHAEFTSRSSSSEKLLGSHPGSLPLITPFCKRSDYALQHLSVCNYKPTFFVLFNILFSSVSRCPTPAKKPTNQTHKQKKSQLNKYFLNEWKGE